MNDVLNLLQMYKELTGWAKDYKDRIIELYLLGIALI
jgi:hypothetical protein